MRERARAFPEYHHLSITHYTYMQMLIVLGIVIVWCRFVFAEAEIATTAAATTAVTACYNGAYDEACLWIHIEKKTIKV